MVVSDVKHCSKTMLLAPVNNKSLYLAMIVPGHGIPYLNGDTYLILGIEKIPFSRILD